MCSITTGKLWERQSTASEKHPQQNPLLNRQEPKCNHKSNGEHTTNIRRVKEKQPTSKRKRSGQQTEGRVLESEGKHTAFGKPRCLCDQTHEGDVLAKIFGSGLVQMFVHRRVGCNPGKPGIRRSAMLLFSILSSAQSERVKF